VNTTEIHARLYRIGREQDEAQRRIETAAHQVREAARSSDVSAGPFALLNMGLMLEKVAVIAAEGVAARRQLQELSEEQKRLEAME
jgi:hypothetical protein